MNYQNLPVYQQKDKILIALQDSPVIVVESPTGSGKTTQLPVILDEAGYSVNGIIGGTQPRRIAALSVSDFIRRQLQTAAGPSALNDDYVGYKMRFEDTTNLNTRIKIMTDGILLQEMKADPLLSRYSVMIVDEAHERSLNIDFILGLLKRILEERKDFRVIISSATLNTSVFSSYFNNCPIIKIDTPMFPVELVYKPIENDNEDLLLDTIEGIIRKRVQENSDGDFLIFLSGEFIIKSCVTRLQNSAVRSSLYILPLYGRLTREEQEQVFVPTPQGKHKVVISTNIAETSITIDGITHVIDSGLAKLNFYNPRTFTSSLVETSISKASCEQRKGRAGRTRPGICYRLYSAEDFTQRQEFTTEEIYRTDLSEVVIRMAELGIRDFESFDFINQPGIEGIRGAVETLKMLDALNPDYSLTATGEHMVRFPLLPRHARILVEGMTRYPQVMEELLIATSFITTNSPYLLPAGLEMEARAAHHHFQDKLGDFISYLKLYRAFLAAKNKEGFCKSHYLDERTMHEIVNIKNQLEEIVSGMGVFPASGGPLKDYLCGLAKGLIQFVCISDGRDGYRSLTASRILIHPGSVMFRQKPDFIVAAEIVKTSRTFARSVSMLKKEWLPEISENLLSSLQGKQKPGKTEKARDTSWEAKIGNSVFRLKPYKGKKKMAILPLRDFTQAVKAAGKGVWFPGALRGTLVHENFEFMEGEKLSNLVKLVSVFDFKAAIQMDWRGRRNLQSARNINELVMEIESSVLKLVPIKKNKRVLGFVGLETDAEGNYWFKVSKSFFSACEISLASMEVLIDELADSHSDSTEILNSVYRKVSRHLEI